MSRAEAAGGLQSVPCAHCGEPAAGPAPAFCCTGCEAAHGAIHAAGLQDYYRLRDSMPAPVGVTGAPPVDPGCLVVGPRGTHVDLAVSGMHCASCAWLIEELLQPVPGVGAVRVSLAREQVRVEVDDAAAAGAAIARLADVGYPARTRTGGEDAGRAGRRQELLRLGVAGAIAMNTMLFAVGLYAGEAFGMAPGLEQAFRWLSLMLALPLVGFCAAPILQRATAALQARQIHVDVPVALAIVVMFGASVAATVRGEGAVWFDSLAMLVVLLLGGRAVDGAVRRKASERLEGLLGRRERTARRLGGAVVSPEHLQSGDRIELRPGDVVPVDAVITSGTSEVDLAVWDGEPEPRPAGPGTELPAGAQVLTGSLEATVLRPASESTLGRLRRQVEETLARRAPEELLADRVARGFVVAVLVLAGGVAAAWSFVDPTQVVPVTVAVLVVACPCALALATPLAFAAAVHGSAARGLIVRDGGVLSALASVERVALDKTGTLTAGRGVLRSWNGTDEQLAVAAAACRPSLHPVARAVVDAARNRGLAVPLAADFAEEVGVGVTAQVGASAVAVGAPGATLRIDGIEVATGAVHDALRPDAVDAVSALRSLGLELTVLSGDQQAAVDDAGQALRVADARGGQTPADKAAAVRAWEAGGERVLFVGDGLNDSEALASASVGLAPGGAVDLSVETADGVLGAGTTGDLSAVVDGVRRARRLRAVLRSNLALSLTYNLIATSLAAAGIIGPLGAAVLMPLSSIVVVARSAQLAGEV